MHNRYDYRLNQAFRTKLRVCDPAVLDLPRNGLADPAESIHYTL